MTFYASDDKLATVGLAGRVDDINRTAVQVARQVAAETRHARRREPLADMGLPPGGPLDANHVRELFDRQLEKQIEAGPPDFWIGETFSYLGEALLFVEPPRQRDFR